MEEEDTGTTVYHYFSHSRGLNPDGYSFYGIDILRNGEKGWVVKNPRLVLRLELKKRHRLVCAKLGSKFYFLGGVNVTDQGLSDDLPSDVMVYDTADSETSKKEVAYRTTWGKPMHYGKLRPLTFEVNGKLYVLGQCNGVSECLFEEYDPKTDCWTVLENPPMGDYTDTDFDWNRSFVLDSGSVLITGSFRVFAFLFNPANRGWRKIEVADYNMLPYPLFVEGSFYGVGMHGGVVRRFGPLNVEGSSFGVSKHAPFSSPDVPFTDMVAIDWGDIEPSSRPWTASWVTQPYISYLGQGIFCAVEADPTYTDLNEPNHFLRFVNVIIYEKITEHPSDNELKCLHLALLTMPTIGNGSLTSCHVMGTVKEKKKKEKKRKRKNKKKKNVSVVWPNKLLKLK